MREEIEVQLRIVKQECFKLAQIANYDRLQVIYNKNRKYNDDGQLDMMHIQHCYSS